MCTNPKIWTSQNRYHKQNRSKIIQGKTLIWVDSFISCDVVFLPIKLFWKSWFELIWISISQSILFICKTRLLGMRGVFLSSVSNTSLGHQPKNEEIDPCLAPTSWRTASEATTTCAMHLSPGGIHTKGSFVGYSSLQPCVIEKYSFWHLDARKIEKCNSLCFFLFLCMWFLPISLSLCHLDCHPYCHKWGRPQWWAQHMLQSSVDIAPLSTRSTKFWEPNDLRVRASILHCCQSNLLKACSRKFSQRPFQHQQGHQTWFALAGAAPSPTFPALNYLPDP